MVLEEGLPRLRGIRKLAEYGVDAAMAAAEHPHHHPVGQAGGEAVGVLDVSGLDAQFAIAGRFQNARLAVFDLHFGLADGTGDMHDPILRQRQALDFFMIDLDHYPTSRPLGKIHPRKQNDVQRKQTRNQDFISPCDFHA